MSHSSWAAEDDGRRAEPGAAGNRLATLELQALVQAVAVAEDAIGVAEQISRSHLPSLTPRQIDTPYMMVGSCNALIDKLIEHRERWSFSHHTVGRQALGQFESVIAELAGQSPSSTKTAVAQPANGRHGPPGEGSAQALIGALLRSCSGFRLLD